MKIAHFGVFAPRACGQYETIKDLILAERTVGMEAEFIDYGFKGKPNNRVGLSDGHIQTVPLSWAHDADIIIRHSDIPKEVKHKPAILALHGRPESSYRLEEADIVSVLKTVRIAARKNIYRTFFTFWEEFVYPWSWLADGKKVHYIPAPVNLDKYTIDGDKKDFGDFRADLNLVAVDMWREDVTPFNLLFAAQYFQEHYHKDTKLHIYGAPVQNKVVEFMGRMQKYGVIGEVGGTTTDICEVYRGADILLTPNIIATRVIRESMASGVPIVAPTGCKYTPYTADPRDYKLFAKMIDNCYRDNTNHTDKEAIRNKAIELFNLEKTGIAMKRMCEDVLSKPKWNGMSITENDWDFLDAFITKQGIKSVVEFGAGASTQLFTKKGLDVTVIETNQEIIDNIMVKIPNLKYILWDGKTPQELNGHNMAFIDGPHKGENREVSYKSVSNSNVPIVACHDIDRPEDRKWIDKYFYNWKELSSNQQTLILERP